jgi:hypothetical protein
LTTVNPLIAVAPMWTAVAPVKLLPVMVIAVPPAAGPVAGDTDVTTGGGPMTVIEPVAGWLSPVPEVVSIVTDATWPVTLAA